MVRIKIGLSTAYFLTVMAIVVLAIINIGYAQTVIDLNNILESMGTENLVTIVDSNGSWESMVSGTTIIISYEPDPTKITCSKIYLAQTIRREDQQGNLIEANDFPAGLFDHKQDDMIQGGTEIDHAFCEKDPYYNGEDLKDDARQGSSDGIIVTPTSFSDRPYYADPDFPDTVTSIASTFEVCPVCVDTGQILDSVTWTYSRTKDSPGDGTTTDISNSTISQEFRDALSKFQTNHENGTKCPEESLSPIPTLSEWKQIFLTLFMLSLVMGFAHRGPHRLAFANGSAMFNGAGLNMLVFDNKVYFSIMKKVGLTVLLGLAAATAILGRVSILDITGTLFCAPLVAYILHLVALRIHDSKEE